MSHTINNNIGHVICSKTRDYVPKISTRSGLNTLYAKL